MPRLKRKRSVKSLPHAYEVKAEISHATLAKAKSALTLQIYRKDLKLGELQIVPRIAILKAVARGASRLEEDSLGQGFAEMMMDRLAYGDGKGNGACHRAIHCGFIQTNWPSPAAAITSGRISVPIPSATTDNSLLSLERRTAL